MVIFASTLGTASVSIPDMPCSATTAPSQAGLVGAGAVYSVKNSTRTGRARVGVHLGLGLHFNLAQAQRWVLHILEVHMHMAIANDKEPTHAKRRRRSRSSSSRGGAHVQSTNAPALQRMWTRQIIHAKVQPLLHLHPFLLLHSHRGRVRTAPSARVQCRISALARLFSWTDGTVLTLETEKGSFESPLSGSGFESIVSHHSSQPQPQPTERRTYRHI